MNNYSELSQDGFWNPSTQTDGIPPPPPLEETLVNLNELDKVKADVEIIKDTLDEIKDLLHHQQTLFQGSINLNQEVNAEIVEGQANQLYLVKQMLSKSLNHGENKDSKGKKPVEEPADPHDDVLLKMEPSSRENTTKFINRLLAFWTRIEAVFNPDGSYIQGAEYDVHKTNTAEFIHLNLISAKKLLSEVRKFVQVIDVFPGNIKIMRFQGEMVGMEQLKTSFKFMKDFTGVDAEKAMGAINLYLRNVDTQLDLYRFFMLCLICVKDSTQREYWRNELKRAYVPSTIDALFPKKI